MVQPKTPPWPTVAHRQEPSWWYQSRPSLAPRLLQPLGRAYGAVAMRRYRAIKPYHAQLPVFCVGNFTAGGTGKTPLTQYIAERLLAAGHKPALLTRGYGGRIRGPHWVDPAVDHAADVGDEPLLLARLAPVLVSRARALGAQAIERVGAIDPAAAFTHIVMDDGLQNPALAKSLTLAVVDARRGVGNGRVMPAGPLRAPLAFQLGLADAIVVNHGFGRVDPTQRLAIADLLAGFSGPILDASVAPTMAVAELLSARVVAFAGIGRPEHFFRMLRELGIIVVDTVTFPDHHRYRADDAASLLQAAKQQGAMLVTTEKDRVRLTGREFDDLRANTTSIPIRMQFNTADAQLLDALLGLVMPA